MESHVEILERDRSSHSTSEPHADIRESFGRDLDAVAV